MENVKRKVFGFIGVLLGLLLVTAHITHAPVWILGFFGVGLSFNFASLWVQLLGLLITVASLALLAKKYKTKYVIGIGLVTVVVLGVFLLLNDRDAGMSGHSLMKEHSEGASI